MLIKKINIVSEDDGLVAYMDPNAEKIYWHDPYGGQFSNWEQATLTWFVTEGMSSSIGFGHRIVRHCRVQVEFA